MGVVALERSDLVCINVLYVLMYVSDWEAVVKLSDDFNGADLRNVCTEAGKGLQ